MTRPAHPTKGLLPVALGAFALAWTLPSAHAQFVYSETSAMVFDGAGVDSGLNPHTVSEGGGGDISINTSLTIQSGSLSISGGTPWGDKLGHQGTGSLTINSGSLEWTIENDNEDRLMIGNGPAGNATVTMNGGTFTVTGPGGYDHQEQNLRFGSDGATISMTLNAGTFSSALAIPVAFGGKWTNTGTTFTNSAGSGLLTIGDGTFSLTGTSAFGVGTNANINFLSTGTGSLSISGWTSASYLALATAGQLQIDGSDVTDLSGFTFSTEGAQGVLAVTAVPEPSTYAAIGGLLALGFAALRRRRLSRQA